MVRLRYKIQISVSSTTAENKDLGNAAYECVIDSEAEGGSWKTQVNAGVENLQLFLPNVASASFLMLRITSVDPNDIPNSLFIKRNAIDGEPLEIAPFSGPKEGHFLMTTRELSALYVTNSGSTDMAVTIFCVGAGE